MMNQSGEGYTYFTISEYGNNPKKCDPNLPALNIILGVIFLIEWPQATWENSLNDFLQPKGKD